MTLVQEAVAGGFARALGRLHLVAADMTAKLVWLLLSMGCVLAGLSVFASAIPPPGEIPPDLAPLVLFVRMARAWPLLASLLVAISAVSFAAWSLLEALVRSRIVGGRPEGQPRGAVFWRFLTSGLLRRGGFILTAAVLLLVLMGPALTGDGGEWSRTRMELPWAWVGGAAVLVMVAFALMLVDTLLRCDAVETLGGHVGSVVAAVSAVGLVEVALRWIALMTTLIAVSLLEPPLALILVVPAIGIGLSVAHSYLLIVRYSAVDIIRQRIETSGIHDHGSGILG